MANFSRSPSFVGPTITGGPPSRVGSAAGTVNLGNAFGSAMASAPDFTDISATSIAARANERATVLGVEGQVAAAGVSALGDVKSAKMIAEAQKAAARKAASGSMFGSALGAVGSIGGLLLSGGLL